MLFFAGVGVGYFFFAGKLFAGVGQSQVNFLQESGHFFFCWSRGEKISLTSTPNITI